VLVCPKAKAMKQSGIRQNINRKSMLVHHLIARPLKSYESRQGNLLRPTKVLFPPR